MRKKDNVYSFLIGVLRKKIKIFNFKDKIVIFVKKIALIDNFDNNFKNKEN